MYGKVNLLMSKMKAVGVDLTLDNGVPRQQDEADQDKAAVCMGYHHAGGHMSHKPA